MSLDKQVRKVYNSRFSRRDKNKLKEEGILPEQAVQYSPRFNVWDISALVKGKVSPEQTKGYSGRFGGFDISSLVENEVSPNIANNFSKRFRGWDIASLIELGCTPEKANKYSRRFDGSDVVKLSDAKVNPSRANKYAGRFNAEDIVKLAKARIPPSRANKYSERFFLSEVIDLANSGVSPTRANNFSDVFPAWQILAFEGMPPGRANKYSRLLKGKSGFSIFDIIEFAKSNVNPNNADKYSERFRRDGIITLSKERVNPDTANSYPERFSAQDIATLSKSGVSPSLAEEYGSFFSGSDIAFLAVRKVSPSEANEYYLGGINLDFALRKHLFEFPLDFEKKQARDQVARIIVGFRDEGIPPDEAREYAQNPNLDHKDIINLFVKNVPSSEAGQYSGRFNIGHILFLHRYKVPPDVANSYDERFSAFNLVRLKGENCLPDEANKYSEKFNPDCVIKLAEKKIPPERANSYPERFKPEEVVRLSDLISPEEAAECDQRFSGNQLYVLYTLGIDIRKISEERKETLLGVLKQTINYIEVKTHPDLFKLLGTGAAGIVLLKKGRAYKFSTDIEKEFRLLKKLERVHRGRRDHIVGLRRFETKGGIAMEIEYIKGDSLDHIVGDQGPLPSKKVIKYGAGIMDGLYGLRQAGIWYHRDIRPANIMIDEKTDKAIVVDLGLATEDKDSLQVHNRRFGSSADSLANDFISLGQVMYFMATGEHIFAESESMTRTFSDIADEIHDYRTRVYADKTGEMLNASLTQVDKIVGGEVADLIKACLTAGNDDYDKMQEMFKRYMK